MNSEVPCSPSPALPSLAPPLRFSPAAPRSLWNLQKYLSCVLKVTGDTEGHRECCKHSSVSGWGCPLDLGSDWLYFLGFLIAMAQPCLLGLFYFKNPYRVCSGHSGPVCIMVPLARGGQHFVGLPSPTLGPGSVYLGSAHCWPSWPVATVPHSRNWLGLLQRLWALGIGVMATDEPRAEQCGKPLAVCRVQVFWPWQGAHR